MTRFARFGLVVSVVAVCGFLGASPAAAHAHLATMRPAADATVAVPPTEVVLTFDEGVQSSFATVAVTGPDGRRCDVGPPIVHDDTVSQPVAPRAVPGRYTVAFRVVSDDGHPVSDQAQFTVAPAAGVPPAVTAADPAVAMPPAVAAAARAGASRHVGTTGRIIVVAVGLAAAALLAVLVRRTYRRRRA